MAAVMLPQFIDDLREGDTACLSPGKVAERLALAVQDIAAQAGVHRNTLRLHPESPRVQEFLRGIVRVISAAASVQPDVERAIFWMKNTPIAAFRHKTAYDLIVEGRTEDVIDYIESIQSGYVG